MRRPPTPVGAFLAAGSLDIRSLGTVRRYCLGRADPNGQCESSPYGKLPPARTADLLHYLPCRFLHRRGISVPSALLQWLQWARNPPFSTRKPLEDRPCNGPLAE